MDITRSPPPWGAPQGPHIHVCRHSVTVVASMRYPLHRRQVMWAFISQSLIFLVSIFGFCKRKTICSLTFQSFPEASLGEGYHEWGQKLYGENQQGAPPPTQACGDKQLQVVTL